MTRGRVDKVSQPLEVIDLASELDTSTSTSGPRWARSRGGWAMLAVAAAGVAALLVLTALGSHHGGAHAARRGGAPISRVPTIAESQITSSSGDRPPELAWLPGRFYPMLDDKKATTLVLPTGETVTLSGGLTNTIGGLGANFSGFVTQKDRSLCCSLIFGISRAAPSDLFDTLGTGAIAQPVLVSAMHAKLAELKQFNGEYGLLSTGDWTLVAAFADGESTASVDATVLERLASWHLRSTTNGAVLTVPAYSRIEQPLVMLGRTSDPTKREVDLTDIGCTARLFPRAIFGTRYNTIGRWCIHGVQIRIFGPRSYVQHALADFKVKVAPAP